MNKNSRLRISATASAAGLSGIDDYFIRITTPIDIKALSLITLEAAEMSASAPEIKFITASHIAGMELIKTLRG